MPANWPQLIVEAGFTATAPVQPAGTLILDDATNGKLDTAALGGGVTWSDLSQWARSGSVNRPASRQQGPLWSSQPGTASVILRNDDGRFDPDNLAGPYVAAGVTELNAMVPVRVRATWNSVAYSLFSGFADSWQPEDGANRGPRYAEAAVAATDGQQVLAGITLPAAGAAGAGEATGARVNRVLGLAGWYTGTGQRQVATGDSTVQATTLGDNAWALMQAAADAEIGELYVDGSGRLVFRNRHAILTDARSNTPQAVFGDSPGTPEADGTEVPYRTVTRSRDIATLANDVQATCTGGTLQQAQDAASIAKYLFPRSYVRSDLILQDYAATLSWAQWVLYVAAAEEDRFDQLVLYPMRDPVSLWPQALGREAGDRIQVWRRPPRSSSPVPYSQGALTSPGTFNYIVQVPIPPGTWTVTWSVSLSGNVTAAEAANFGIIAEWSGGDSGFVQSANPAAVGTWQQQPVTVTVPVAGATLAIKTAGATPASGSVYGAATPAPAVKDCFIRGITHAWDWSAGTWATTWTLQDAGKYGSFLTLDNATLGRLDSNALAF